MHKKRREREKEKGREKYRGKESGGKGERPGFIKTNRDIKG